MAYKDYTWVVGNKKDPAYKGYKSTLLDLTDLKNSVDKYWKGVDKGERRFSIDRVSFEKLFGSSDKMTIRVSDIDIPEAVSLQFLAYDPNEQSNDYVLFMKCYELESNDPEPNGFITLNTEFNSVMVRIGASLATNAPEKYAIFVQGATITFTNNKVSGTTSLKPPGTGTPAGSSNRVPTGS